MPTVTFFKVARKPKWIAGLLLALSVAAIFASLAAWQVDRTYRYVPKTPVSKTAVALNELAKSSSPFLSSQADRLVTVNVTRNPAFTYIVANREQLVGTSGDHASGYWAVEFDPTDDGKFISLATGWYATLSEAKQVLEHRNDLSVQVLQTVEGIYEPSEEARTSNGSIFQTLSIEQLINQPGLPENVDAYAGFVIVQGSNFGGDQIVIGRNPGETTFNWLTAFYAVEWVLFAGFAVFLWGRVVQDEVNRQNRKG